MFGIQDKCCIQGVQKKVLSELLDLALIIGACTQYAHNTVSVAGLQRRFKQAPIIIAIIELFR